MTDWSTLEDAYGPATEIPAILAALTSDPSSEVWNELWSRVCHQGTVYSASYAALPDLFELASSWAPKDRVSPLVLAGHIVASRDVHGTERPARAGAYADLLGGFHRLALETLPFLEDPESFIHALEAALAFESDSFWGRDLNRLADGEFSGLCPSCDVALHLMIGKLGFFATAGERVNRPSTKRTAIQPANADHLPPVGRWIADQASRAGHDQVGEWARYAFGTTDCPACGAKISVPDAIHASDESVWRARGAAARAAIRRPSTRRN